MYGNILYFPKVFLKKAEKVTDKTILCLQGLQNVDPLFVKHKQHDAVISWHHKERLALKSLGLFVGERVAVVVMGGGCEYRLSPKYGTKCFPYHFIT